MKRPSLWPLMAVLALADCGGGATVAGGGTTPPAASLSFSPSSVSFSGSSGQRASVSVSGATGSLSFAVADPTIARVTPTAPYTFTVTPLAGGSTTVKVTDGAGATGTFPVSTYVCVPPSPALDWVYPAYGSSNVPVGTGNIWFAIYLTGNPIESTITDSNVYLIGSDGSTIQGQNLVQNNTTPPAGSTPPAPGYTYTYYTSAISGLKAGLTYKVQLVDAKEQCLPPLVYGSFST